MFVHVQMCMYCEDAASATIEEDLPDMDMGELGEELGRDGQRAQSQPEESKPQSELGS